MSRIMTPTSFGFNYYHGYAKQMAFGNSFLCLALLDYVSRAHEMEICPLSVVRSTVVCRPSSVRVAIISEPNARISFKFWFLLPLCHTLRHFLIFFCFGFFYEYYRFVNMGPYGSENFKTLFVLQVATESFQTFLEFLFLMVLAKPRLEFSKF